MLIVVLLAVAVLGPEASAVHAQSVGSVAERVDVAKREATKVEAIQQWRYEPTRLSGVAIPATNITFLFSYGS